MIRAIRWLRCFWERGTKGYCFRDLWSFDSWLSKTIARGLKEFRQNCCGYPNDIDDWDKWMAVLDEMAECFEEQTRDIDNLADFNSMKAWMSKDKDRKKKLHRGFQLLEKYYYDLWD